MSLDDSVVQSILESESIDLVDVMRLAAVPRWFDIRLLRRLLPDKQSIIWRMLPELEKFPFVESGPATGSWQYLPEVREILLALVSSGERLDVDTIAYQYFDQQFNSLTFEREEALVYLVEKLYHQLRIDEDGAYEALDLFCYYFFKLHQLEKIPFLLSAIDDRFSTRAALLREFYEVALLNRRQEGDSRDVEAIYKELLEAPSIDETLKIKVRVYLAKLYADWHEFPETKRETVMRLYRMAGEDAEERNQKQLLAIVLQNRSKFLAEGGQLDEAIRELETGLTHIQGLLDGSNSSPELNTGPQQEQLLAFIQSYFDLDEIKELCMKLSIRYQDLSGRETITAKAIGLIGYVDRHGMREQFLRRLEEERPHARLELVPASPRLDVLAEDVVEAAAGKTGFPDVLTQIYQIDLCSMWNDLAIAYIDKYRVTREPEYLKQAKDVLYQVLDKAPKVKDEEGLAYARASLAEMYIEEGDVHLTLEHLCAACEVALRINQQDLFKWMSEFKSKLVLPDETSGSLSNKLRTVDHCLDAFQLDM